jgi:hypothetical protein
MRLPLALKMKSSSPQAALSRAAEYVMEAFEDFINFWWHSCTRWVLAY